MDSILIIEDNKDVNLMLREALANAGYSIKSAFTGTDGLTEAKTESHSLILLDIMLPYKSGDVILKEIRQFSNIPVIIISAKDLIETKIDLLKLGADDYITKPFDLDEVVARVETNLRRVQMQKTSVFSYKDIRFDGDTKQVFVNNVEVILTAKELKMLEMLISHPNKIFSKANLYESIWETDYLGDDNAVKTHMSNLRNKLKRANPTTEYIETVWGMGYRLHKE